MKKNSVLSFVLLILALVGTVWYVQPLIEQDGQMALTEEQQRTSTEQARLSLEAAKATKAEFDGMTEAEKEKLRTQIPSKLEQQSLLEEMQSIAEKNNVQLSSITFSALPEKDALRRVSIVANFASSSPLPSTAISLLSTIETSSRLLTVKSLSLLFAPTRSDFSITLESYYKNR